MLAVVTGCTLTAPLGIGVPDDANACGDQSVLTFEALPQQAYMIFLSRCTTAG